MTYLLIALGGAAGAVLRYLVGMAVAFPMGTMVVNVLGSFVMGLALVWVAHHVKWSPLVMTGLLGGFTTFSAFSLDTLKLVETGRLGTAALYVTGSVVLSLMAVFAGVMLARGAGA
ncbi:fluoride efflux transporter CrcB [Algirhabdus cladophorae]|uniref:fluoride efflux transporter CrcB n=1 Tax=Algirhabdus cladophorae TaxID=3377108 RepID=UPI003B846280